MPCSANPPSTDTSAQTVRLIPMEDFFRKPEREGYELSPDGRHIAFMMPWKRRMNVYVQKTGEDGEPVRITAAEARDIAGFGWASDSRILYLQDQGGNENFHAYAVNIDGSDPKDLTPFEGVRVGIVDPLKDIDNEMLISMNKRDARVFDVYHLNVLTGELKLVAENPGNITGWMTDHNGKLRVAVTTDGVDSSLLYRPTESSPWETLITTNFKNTFDPLIFDYENQNLYVESNLDRDKTAIYRYDPETRKLGDLIYERPEVDVSRLLSSDKRKKITGVAYVTDKVHYHFFDDQRRRLQEELESRLPGYEVAVTSMDRAETRVVARTYSDKSMGAYYFYNLETGDFRKLAELSPWLKESEMADMKPVTYQARDGLTIHGYLTLPKGLPAEHLPVVINPHGGPWVRDVWGFNPEVQFLANRGLAVLQMNFRGSTGYGKAFWMASFKQWGRKMQDDVTDGVKWLIGRKVADPERVGIYGASYGGYVVLAGLAFTPDLYRCGVDYVGVSNIFTLLKTIPPYWEPGLKMMYEQIGDPEKDKKLLEEISPVFHADQIEAPLLIAQGANDPRVNKDESDQIVNALKKRGVTVEYMVKENEGHGFHNEENQFDFYRAMEKFFGQYLGSRVEKSGGKAGG